MNAQLCEHFPITWRDNSVRQSLSHRLAITADSCRPWPDRPIAIALVITDLDVGGAERALVSPGGAARAQRDGG